MSKDLCVCAVGHMNSCLQARAPYIACTSCAAVPKNLSCAPPLPLQTPWARWTRGWTAEENRHGDLMNKYCYLSGRVNMRVCQT